MIKVVSMMKRREGLTIEEFRRWALEDHPKVGEQLPGIRRYHMSVVIDEHSDGPYDAVSELYFDSTSDFEDALGSDVGAQAGADIASHCADDRFRIYTEEKVIVS